MPVQVFKSDVITCTLGPSLRSSLDTLLLCVSVSGAMIVSRSTPGRMNDRVASVSNKAATVIDRINACSAVASSIALKIYQVKIPLIAPILDFYVWSYGSNATAH